jgi:Predicted outer membrane protein
MKALNFFIGIFAAVWLAAACNTENRREADDSVDQAQDVNDTSAMVNDEDSEFAVKAADAGLAEIELGKLALEKATDGRVKNFAERMVADHQKANDELMTIATKHNITLPPAVSEDHVDNQRKLRERSGRDFDREYMDLMVSDHNKAVSMFEDAASDAANADLKAFATKTLPILREHHEHAKALRDSIGGGRDTTTVERIIP